MNTTSSNVSLAVDQTDIIFNMVTLHLIGISGVIANIFIVYVIKKHKQLQTPCFLLISGECICSTVLAAGFLENAIEEAAQFTGILPEERARALCFLTKSLALAWSILASSLVTVCISLDRLISILNPMKYRMLGKRYAYSILGACYTFATCAAVAGFSGSNSEGYGIDDRIPCIVFFSPFTPGYLTFYGSFNLSFSVVCILLYGIMLITFKVRQRRLIQADEESSPGADPTAATFMRQQLACMPAIKLLMAYYSVTAAAPEIGVAIMSSSISFRQYLPRFFYYAAAVKALTSMAEIFALSLGSQQFRQCARAVLTRENGSVVRSIRMQSSALVGKRRKIGVRAGGTEGREDRNVSDQC